MAHELVGNEVTAEPGGIIARCVCGWSSGLRFSGMLASALFREHLAMNTPDVAREQEKNLYDVARIICHQQGMPWTDPRTGQRHDPPSDPPEFALHDYVKKTGGDYTFHGWVIMMGRKTSGQWRYAVENDDGLIHIFSAKQLAKVEPK